MAEENKHMNWHLTSLAFGEMQVKIIMRNHCPTPRAVQMNNNDTNGDWQPAVTKWVLVPCLWERKMAHTAALENRISFLKTKAKHVLILSSGAFLGFIREIKM